MNSPTSDSSIDISPLDSAPSTSRPDRARFKLVCPIRLLGSNGPLGEFRTVDINCESVSCLLPDPLMTGPVQCGDILQCEIDLRGTAVPQWKSPVAQLRGQLEAIRVTSQDTGIVEVCFRLLDYEIA